jgi:putative transposase
MLLMLAGLISFIEIFQVKYLNNLIEQDHRFIKKITKPMMEFKSFHSAQATIDGIERGCGEFNWSSQHVHSVYRQAF